MNENGGFAPACQWMFLTPAFSWNSYCPAARFILGYLDHIKPCGFLDETLGVIAQLVERLHGMEEVWGSTPHGSTKCSLWAPRYLSGQEGLKQGKEER